MFLDLVQNLATAAVLAAAYAVNIWGGAALVSGLLRRYRLETPGSAENGVQDAPRGRIIGILERLVVLTLVLVNQWAAIGLVIAAKSIARFKDLEQRSFSEYYLIGTLASLLVAMFTGLLVRWLVL